MSLEYERLLSLIEFAQQTALLRTSPTTDVKKHKLFIAFQHTISELPGLQFNISSDDELWLTIDRLTESHPPIPKNATLKAWIKLINDPSKPPTLLPHLKVRELVNTELLISDTQNPEEVMTFASLPQREEIERLFKNYLEKIWKPWAEVEKLRRKTISLYAELFTLKQQLDGNIVDAALELVWGTGIAVWDMDGTKITYPIITQVVEISLNEITMSLTLRPRNVEPLVNLSIYSAVNNPGVIPIEKMAKDFFSKSIQPFSPFYPSTFEPVLQAAVTYLDPNGSYLPLKGELKLPEISLNLQITDTWVLFARPRNASLFIQDLENFKQKLEDKEPPSLSHAALALVTEPSTENIDLVLPAFRGLSVIGGNDCQSQKSPQDLFFPKPFNDEQVRIIQLLENSSGVVVQGPPGTGKTHSIANIICHYLACGKKVLVTSMKEPALSVLREKLPKEIQPLVISLLNNESEGMKQIEEAVSKIASEVQNINRKELNDEISFLERHIDFCHASISGIDRQIKEWAIKNLTKIDLENEECEPAVVAKEIILSEHLIGWFDDSIDISEKYNPLFSDEDILQLRHARKILDKDLQYLNCQLPTRSILPNKKELSQIHELLALSAKLQAQIDSEELSNLNFSVADDEIEELESQISRLRLLKILSDKYIWAPGILELLRKEARKETFSILDELSQEINTWIENHNQFLRKSISIPQDADQNSAVIEAVANLANGKRPFSIIQSIGKRKVKASIDAIRFAEQIPSNASEWDHVHRFFLHLKKLRELLARWNTLCPLLQLPVFSFDPVHAFSMLDILTIYGQLKEIVFLENNLFQKLEKLLPNLKSDVFDKVFLEEAEKILHILSTFHQATEAEKKCEQVIQSLNEFNGPIVQEISHVLKTLGKFSISEIPYQWETCLNELGRVHLLRPYFDTVDLTCSLIEKSGAKKWAWRLRSEPRIDLEDALLPENWREIWRLKRLSTYLHAIDGRLELKKLMDKRSAFDTDLAKAYQDIVTKKTWLKISENATPDVRSALMAYLAAILKIGKGKGKRAFRYRQDARIAATRSHSAIPCWIMPHFRISESLPIEFGCFDLVIIDEASQSDLEALPALLRAKKVLIVGDDKQISPEGIGLEEEQIRNLISRFLANQVSLYRGQMTPERSIYDLFKVVFAQSTVMLKEHFRSVTPIIEYSKREFYNHELKPLRIAKPLEKLDPPLIDVFVQDGFRKGDINSPEAQFIVEEIKAIVQHPKMTQRSIGIVSLLGDQQALYIWKKLEAEIGLELIKRHQITCGDARTFQGKERDIMFLSMVASAKDISPLSRDTFAQRFNVAASRARDRMYLVRSVKLEDLSHADQLRRKLIAHFSTPFAQDERRVQDCRSLCESPFEREIYDVLTERGYRVIPQVAVGGFRIDMVVEGHGDAQLAIECDGDAFHGPDRWDHDMRRQRILERAGWKFWRCFASTFVLRRQEMIEDLLLTLENHGIKPIGNEGAERSFHVEQRLYTFSSKMPKSEKNLEEELEQ